MYFMKHLAYIALTFGALGLLSLIMTIFSFTFCYITLGLFGISIILFIVCTITGACCATKRQEDGVR